MAPPGAEPASTAAGAPVAATPGAGGAIGRATLTIAAWNAVSRATGFVRVLAVGAALGATFLGITYQSANLVSTLTFELAAGVVWATAAAGAGLFDHAGRAGAVVDLAAGGVLAVVAGGLVLWGTGGLRTAGLTWRHPGARP